MSATGPASRQQSTGRSSLTIGRLLGVDVRVHWTFAFLLVLIVLSNLSAGARSVADGLLWVVAIFASVLLHELAHCVVAKRDGVVVDDILLIPIGGVSRMHELPKDAGEELAIAIAGPAASFGIAVIAGVVAVLIGQHLLPPTLLAGSWVVRIAWLNVLLGAFNLIPALPMDGGRVLRAALAMKEPRSRATHTAARIARFLAFAMIVVGLAYDVWLVLIGIFVMMAAGAEERAQDVEDDEERRRGAPPGVPPPLAES